MTRNLYGQLSEIYHPMNVDQFRGHQRQSYRVLLSLFFFNLELRYIMIVHMRADKGHTKIRRVARTCRKRKVLSGNPSRLHAVLQELAAAAIVSD